MRRLRLNDGRYTLLDDRDYAFFRQWAWGTASGYAARGERRKGHYRKILLHVEVAKRSGFYKQGLEVDHVNRRRRDNRRDNLRSVTKSRNQHNAGPRRDSTTGCRGITQRPNGHFVVRIQVDKQRRYIGTFPSIREARQAYAKARHQYKVTAT